MAVVPTVRVRDKQTGAEYLINVSDFDAARHSRVRAVLTVRDEPEPEAEPEAEPEPEPESAVVFGTQPRDVLATMTLSALYALPEYQALSSEVRTAGFASKDDLIDALLAVRED